MNNSSKILHVISSLETGGAQKLLADILESIKDNAAVDVLVFKNADSYLSKRIRTAGIHIINLNKRNTDISIIRELRKYFKRYDLIHIHLFPALYYAAIASMGLNIKLVFTEHSTTNRRRYKQILRPIEKFIYSQYSSVICVSSQAAASLQEWIGLNTCNILTIENGVNLDYYKAPEIINRKKQIVMVSRFAPAKDQETVIRAMPYVNDDLSLVFAGDGETLDRAKQLVETLHLGQRVFFLGNCTDIRNLLWDSLIGIQSSKWEGFGLTAVEIMAAGLPIIATDVEGLRQVVADAGIIIPVGDEKTLAQEINHLYEDKSFYDMVQSNCIERSKAFSIKKTAERYLSLYNKLLDNGSKN